MVLMFSGFTFNDNRVSIAAFFKEFVIDSFHCETMSVILKNFHLTMNQNYNQIGLLNLKPY